MNRFGVEERCQQIEETRTEEHCGELEVRHEHFFSEVLENQLRALRASLEPSGSGWPVVIATLDDLENALLRI